MEFEVRDMWLAPGPDSSAGEWHYYQSPEEAVAGICQKGDHDGCVAVYENHLATVEKLSCVLFRGRVLRAYLDPQEAESAAQKMRSATSQIAELPYGHKVSIVKIFKGKKDFNSFVAYQDLPEEDFYQRNVPRLDL